MNKIAKTTVREINSLHAELEDLVRTGIDKAIRIGELLNDCKEALPHGQFTRWVEQNCKFTLRSAQNYMKVFQNRAKLTGASSLNDAYRLLKPEKSETLSFLDTMREHLQHTINEDLPALDAFRVRHVADKLPDPGRMEIESLSAYVKDLEEAQQIATECLLRSRRKLGELMGSADINDADRQRLRWLRELYSIHPDIRLYEKGMHIPDGITFEQWQKIYELLQKLQESVTA